MTAPAMGPGASAPRWRFPAAVAAAALAFVGLGLWTGRDAAPTFDEVAHLGAAFDHVSRGAFVLNREHPPLAKLIAGLGLLTLDLEGREPVPPPAGTRDPERHWFEEQWRSGLHLLLAQPTLSPMDIVRRARLPLLLLGVPLIAAIGLGVRTLAGVEAGIATAWLVALCPTLVAHARLVHNDFALAVWITLALLQAERLARRHTLPGALVLGVLGGLALATKYSALLLAPVLAVVAIADLAWGEGRQGPGGRVRAAACWARTGAISVAVAALVASSSTGRFAPERWLEGLRILLADTRHGYEFYCAGRFSAEGFPYYFPLLLALKLPLAVLVLAALSVPALARMPRAERARVLVHLVLPAAALLALTMHVAFPIGVRYVLPVVPPVLALAGIGAGWCWRRGRVARLVVALVLVGHATWPLRTEADPLAWFNALAGGPRGGWRWFDDSNVDWGEKLPALVAWHGTRTAAAPGSILAVGHFGSIPPERWPGSAISPHPIPLRWRLLLPEFDELAVSPHLLVREARAITRLGVHGLPWTDPARVRGRVADTYLVYQLEVASDGSGDVVVAGAEPLRIARAEWIAGARARLAGGVSGLRAGGGGPADAIQIHWQAARFFERWDPDGADAAAARDAIDAIVARIEGAGARLALPAELAAEMRRFYEARGDAARAARYGSG